MSQIKAIVSSLFSIPCNSFYTSKRRRTILASLTVGLWLLPAMVTGSLPVSAFLFLYHRNSGSWALWLLCGVFAFLCTNIVRQKICEAGVLGNAVSGLSRHNQDTLLVDCAERALFNVAKDNSDANEDIVFALRVARRVCNGIGKDDEALVALSRLTHLRCFSLDPTITKNMAVADLVYDVLFYLDARHRLFYIKRPVFDDALIGYDSERWVWTRIREIRTTQQRHMHRPQQAEPVLAVK